ncbi:MAG TPA: hypothetical protein VFW84_05360 [Aquabacterium sp.]|uniref:hypothetical protein n=1 Tax=Aquabacterium sp. TaxID=1872578 RepID=UPI002E317D37|nr:hypothetical protein [Aquabacterium sp.]HEX5372144.1 hypothetical protein [Aquabacterium sp.]
MTDDTTMTSATAPLLLNLTAFDDDDDGWTDLGQLTLSADGLLSVKAITAPTVRAKVEEFVKLTNDKPGLHMDTAPLPGSPQFAVASRFIARGEPDFLAAIVDYADKYYGWTVEVG